MEGDSEVYLQTFFGSRCRSVINFTPKSLNPAERVDRTQWTEGWLHPRADEG